MDNLANELLQLIISYHDELSKYHIYKSTYFLTLQRKGNPLRVINTTHNNYNLVKCDSMIVGPSLLETIENLMLYPKATIMKHYYVNMPKYSDTIKKLTIINNIVKAPRLPKYLQILQIFADNDIITLPEFPDTLTSLTIITHNCPELFLPNSLIYLNVENCPKINYPNNLKVLKYDNCPIYKLPTSIHTIYFPDNYLSTGLNLIKALHKGHFDSYPDSIKTLIILDEVHNVTLPPFLIKLAIHSNSEFDIPSQLKKLVLLKCSGNFFKIFNIDCVVYEADDTLNYKYVDYYRIFKGKSVISELTIVNNTVKNCIIFVKSEIILKNGIENLTILLSYPVITIPPSVRKLKIVFSPSTLPIGFISATALSTVIPASLLHPDGISTVRVNYPELAKIYQFEVSEEGDYSDTFTKVVITLPKQLRHIIVNCNDDYPIEWVTPSDLLICNSTGKRKVIIPARFIKI